MNGIDHDMIRRRARRRIPAPGPRAHGSEEVDETRFESRAVLYHDGSDSELVLKCAAENRHCDYVAAVTR